MGTDRPGGRPPSALAARSPLAAGAALWHRPPGFASGFRAYSPIYQALATKGHRLSPSQPPVRLPKACARSALKGVPCGFHLGSCLPSWALVEPSHGPLLGGRVRGSTDLGSSNIATRRRIPRPSGRLRPGPLECRILVAARDPREPAASQSPQRADQIRSPASSSRAGTRGHWKAS